MCAICGAGPETTELYAATHDGRLLNAAVFSARRLPDGVHGRIVRCRSCGLVRTDPAIAPRLLAELYRRSTFEYSDETPGLRRTYRRYLAALDAYGARKEALVEIGCGSGFFLEEALALGFRRVAGVDPSVDAVRRAADHVRPHIVCDIAGPAVFGKDAFDVACMFQTFDHLHDPGGLLDECWRMLKPGGLFLCLCHNVESVSARWLGERSPIVDIAHPYLYSPGTLSAILRAHGFLVHHVGPARNDCTIGYLVWLLPAPARLTDAALRRLKRSSAGRIRVRLPLGNMYAVGQKPAAGSPGIDRMGDR